VAVCVENRKSRKRHTDIGIADYTVVKTLIKTRQHNVVVVQNMYPLPAGSLNAPIPSVRQTSVFGFAMERYPPCANAAANFRSGVILRAVVDHFDLHLV
jgi:hypothetical protein